MRAVCPSADDFMAALARRIGRAALPDACLARAIASDPAERDAFVERMVSDVIAGYSAD